MSIQNQIAATQIADTLIRIRETQPVIHNITNYVAMTFNANALLAIGASPIMAHAIEEIAEIVQLAQAVIINTGTLDPYWLTSMAAAMNAANQKSIPIILDPVGAGATSLRTQAVLSLMDAIAPQVIRGNAAEILALAGQKLLVSKGVDSAYQSQQACAAGRQLAAHYQCTVVISGEQDVIIDSQAAYVVDNGVSLMSKVTGMGCTATALIGAFCAMQPNPLIASASAMAVMGIAGEIALSSAHGPASLQMHFVDALYNLQAADIAQRLKLQQVTL